MLGIKEKILVILLFLLAARGWSVENKATASSPYITDVLDQYFHLEKALADSRLGETQYRAESMMAFWRRAKGRKGLPREFEKQVEDIRDAAAANNLVPAREHFKMVSQMLIAYVHRKGITDYTEVYCPAEKARWLQEGRTIQNPYTGKSGPISGEIVHAGALP